jgi:hypothetical protein
MHRGSIHLRRKKGGKVKSVPIQLVEITLRQFFLEISDNIINEMMILRPNMSGWQVNHRRNPGKSAVLESLPDQVRRTCQGINCPPISEFRLKYSALFFTNSQFLQQGYRLAVRMFARACNGFNIKIILHITTGFAWLSVLYLRNFGRNYAESGNF